MEPEVVNEQEQVERRRENREGPTLSSSRRVSVLGITRLSYRAIQLFLASNTSRKKIATPFPPLWPHQLSFAVRVPRSPHEGRVMAPSDATNKNRPRQKTVLGRLTALAIDAAVDASSGVDERRVAPDRRSAGAGNESSALGLGTLSGGTPPLLPHSSASLASNPPSPSPLLRTSPPPKSEGVSQQRTSACT